MDFIPPIQVKVSGLRRVEDARQAVAFGVSAIGLSADGPGESPLSLDEIGAISDAVGPEIGTFLLTSARDPRELASLALRARVNTLHLREPLPAQAYDELRSASPGLSIAQSIHVTEATAVDRAIAMSGLADALVLDPVDPYRLETGSSESPLDWQLCRRIVASVQMPVILSGGLTTRNVADAIRAVRPFGVDIRPVAGGSLDLQRLVGFLEVLGRMQP